MKNFLLNFIFILTVNVTFGFEFSGEIHQEGKSPVTIMVFHEDGTVDTYFCPQTKTFFGLSRKTSFSLDLEPNKRYTLVFRSYEEEKIVYLDTKDGIDYDGFICKLQERNAIIFYDSFMNLPVAWPASKFAQSYLRTFPKITQ